MRSTEGSENALELGLLLFSAYPAAFLSLSEFNLLCVCIFRCLFPSVLIRLLSTQGGVREKGVRLHEQEFCFLFLGPGVTEGLLCLCFSGLVY